MMVKLKKNMSNQQQQFEVLGGDAVCQVDSLVKRVRQHSEAVALNGNARSVRGRQSRQLMND
jgi:hypothetical protein